jgi:hypothetical protein
MATIDEIANELDQIVRGIVFTMPGRDQSLARDLCGVVAQGIIDRTVAEQRSASGAGLKRNEPQYAAWKAKKYGSYQPLIRTGQLLSLASVLGNPAIGDGEIRMTYGLDVAPSRSSTGYITDADRAVTDKQKADFVSDDRPFYELDDAIAEKVIEAAGEAIGRYIEEHW